MKSGPAIAASGVVRRYGERTILDHIDLHVGAGEIHALLGPNGAGKTTLIRLLSGLVAPDGGVLQVAGPVGLVPSGDRSFYMRLSCLENLIFFARLNGLRLRAARRRAHEVLEQVGLADAARRPAGRCSHGMQKRLGVARALLVAPRVLLVDEATDGLDPEGAQRIYALVRELAAAGAGVLWTTQRVEEIRGFADTVTFLQGGRVRFCGPPSELAELAPRRRYVLTVRGPVAGGEVSVAALQLAVGAAARVGGGNPASGCLLTPSRPGDLGAAVAHLFAAGYEVVSCRQEGAEIEEAFLALAEGAAA